jgi:hypothetical protein
MILFFLKINNTFVNYFLTSKQKIMKKLFAVLAVVAIMTSCKDKNKEETKPSVPTTSTPEITTPKEPTTATTGTAGVPKFSDPEVQKFANDYAAFIAEYKSGMKDPAKLMELSKTAKEWAAKGQSIPMKMAAHPEEAKAWAEWWLAMNKEMMPSMK